MLKENVVDHSYQFLEIDKKIFNPFEINNRIDTPLTEIDPDLQFYTENHYICSTKCEYYLEEQFVSEISSNERLDTKMSLFHMNIKSLPKHFDELQLYLDSIKFKFSIIGLTETWLDENKHGLYELDNYISVNKFRKEKRGGGVSLYLDENITYRIRDDLDYFDSELEMIVVEIDKDVFKTNSNVIMGLIYRIPNTPIEVFNDRIADILNTAEREQKICYFMGDLNIDLFKTEEHRHTSDFLDIMYSHSLFPLITKPTRVTGNSATLIDHIFTNNFETNVTHTQGILCTSISDHYAVFHIAGNMHGGQSSSDSENDTPVMKRNMCQRNMQKFIDKVNMVNWEHVTDSDNAQEAYTLFHAKLSDIYNACFPLKKIKKKYYTSKPWLTEALKESIKTKNKLYISRYKAGNHEENVAYYKRYRNRLNHVLRAAERKYYQNLINEHKSNVKKSWQIMKMIINKRKYKPVCKKFKHNDQVIENGYDIANRFNRFFVNVGSTLANKIPVSNECPLDFMKFNNASVFGVTQVEESEIVNIIGNFNDSAAGWDEFKPKVIKSIKHSVKIPLAHISNLSFTSGIFPKELKIANIVPIFKADDEMVFTNYRPVSVLPVFSKLLERLMYNRLIDYINENQILYKYQFGFQKGKSTYMALIVLLDKISAALDNGDYVIGVFLDFSKAFDTVDHKILLQKLDFYGIKGVTYNWFEDYLRERKQYVTYNAITSDMEVIKCGVPQGSILGPLLFLLYINDLATVTNACFPILFADDTNVFITGKSMEEMCTKMNDELEKIQGWLNCNKLSLNVLKTHYMLFASRNKCINDADIRINNISIQRVYVTKFLGVLIDSKLNWKNHIDYICKKVAKCIGILLKARKNLHRSSLISLYYSFAYPYFIYCNHVWGNSYKTNLEPIVLMQKKLIRIITCSPFRAHTGPLFFANKILSVTQINTYMVGTYMYKCLNESVPQLLRNYFTRNNSIHEYSTRGANEIHVPFGRLDIRNFSIRIHGAKVWNSLPSFVKQSRSLELFKNTLRNYLFSSESVVIVTQSWWFYNPICFVLKVL